jgi:GAF domain-containing protein
MSPAHTETPAVAAQQAANAALPVQVAIPLLTQEKVTGVLEIQARPDRSIGPAEAETLQLLADQLAVSIQNAELVAHSRTTVAQLESLTARSTREIWQQYLRSDTRAYEFTSGGVRPVVAHDLPEEVGRLRVPILLRGQEIGAIHLRRKSGTTWAQAEYGLIDKVAAQVALALENARLLEQTRHRAAEEEIIGEVSARFSRSLDVDALLQTAVREFAALPDVAEATVLLKPTSNSNSRT